MARSGPDDVPHGTDVTVAGILGTGGTFMSRGEIMRHVFSNIHTT